MAIKVKHDMNAAPAAAAGVASGRARRSMETARLFASGSGGGRGGGTQGATAHPVAPMGAHAQLTHASAPAVSAHAPAYHDTIDDRLRLQEEQNRAALERQELGEDAALKRLGLSQDFTEGQNRRREEFSTAERIAKDEAARKEWDRQHGILRQERDADRIAAGTHEYGYSPEVQREYDRLQREYDEGLQKGRYLAGSDDERRFMEDMERKIAALPKTLVPRNDSEGMFKRNTYTDEQGRIFTTDGKLVYNPADADTRRMEFQQKQMDAMRSAADKLYTELKKPRKVTRMVDGSPEVMFEERSDEEVMRIMQEQYPQLFPAPPAQPAPTAQPPSPFQQALQNWLKNPLGTGAQPAAQPAPTAQPPAASAPAAQTAPPAQPAPTAQQPAAQPESQAQPVIRQDSQGVNWEIVFDANGKPIGKRRVRQ